MLLVRLVLHLVERLRGIRRREGRQANFTARLSLLAIRLGFDSIKAHLVPVVIATTIRVEAPHPRRVKPSVVHIFSAVATLAAGSTTPPAREGAAGEEEEDPCGEGHPNCSTEGSRAVDRLDALFNYEEKDDVEYESDEGDEGGEAGDTSRTASHGHLTDVRKQAEERRDACGTEGDDMQEKSIGDPFHEDGRNLGEGNVVAEEGVRVYIAQGQMPSD